MNNEKKINYAIFFVCGLVFRKRVKFISFGWKGERFAILVYS